MNALCMKFIWSVFEGRRRSGWGQKLADERCLKYLLMAESSPCYFPLSSAVWSRGDRDGLTADCSSALITFYLLSN